MCYRGLRGEGSYSTKPPPFMSQPRPAFGFAEKLVTWPGFGLPCQPAHEFIFNPLRKGSASVKGGRAGSPLPAARREWDVDSSANARRRAEDCPPYLTPSVTEALLFLGFKITLTRVALLCKVRSCKLIGPRKTCKSSAL